MIAKPIAKQMYTNSRHYTRNNIRNKHRGLTLIELIVVILLIALLFSLLAPALQAARKLSRTDVCLANLKAQGQAISTYASSYGTLPGPLHPAIYREQKFETWEYYGWPADRIRGYMAVQFGNVMSHDMGSRFMERIVTCPTMEGIVPNSHFEYFRGSSGVTVLPFHYTLNTWYNGDDYSASRQTDPFAYFGYVVATTPIHAPRAITEISNPSHEWMTADAWYRHHPNITLPFLQQEGPYQSEWSGNYVPNFAPHLRRAGGSYTYLGSERRDIESSLIRRNKSDGATNTVFFDGHAETVPSKTAEINGFELLYGFPGTVNPTLTTSQHETIWNMLRWR